MQKLFNFCAVTMLAAICEGSQSQIRLHGGRDLNSAYMELAQVSSSASDGPIVNENSSIGMLSNSQRQVQEMTSMCFASVKDFADAEANCSDANTLVTTNGLTKTADSA